MNTKTKLLNFKAEYREDDDCGGSVVTFQAQDFRSALKHAIGLQENNPNSSLDLLAELDSNGKPVREWYGLTLWAT